MRGVWIEICIKQGLQPMTGSLPMRGVWIEITQGVKVLYFTGVTPHAGSVD